MIEFKLYGAGLSLPMVSEITGIPKSTLRFRLKKHGALRTRMEGIAIAARVGRIKSPVPKGSHRDEFTPQHRSRISIGRQRWADENAKGTRINTNGYIEYTRGPHKGRSVHSVAMEKRLGRRLYSYECVHHRNGNKTDNKPGNLALMTRSKHTRLHRRIKNGTRRE